MKISRKKNFISISKSQDRDDRKEEKCSIDFETVARQRQQPLIESAKSYNYNATRDNSEVRGEAERGPRADEQAKHNFSIIIADSIRLGRGLANVQHLQRQPTSFSPNRAGSV